MLQVRVDITIYDTKTGDYLQIPVVPEKISYTDGEALVDTVKILNLGNVDFPSGVDLDSIGWNSTFPARYDAAYCSTANLLAPTEYRNILSGWKDSKTPLRVVIPAMDVNKAVYLKRFTWDLVGFEGDIDYSLELREYKTIAPRKVTVGQTAQPVDQLNPVDRMPMPDTAAPATYTVQAGDSLTLIAKRLGIVDWHTLYDTNKATIGTDPNIVKVGQVLTV